MSARLCETFKTSNREATLDDVELARLADCREKRTAYNNVFNFVAGYVKDNVIDGGVVLRMTMLRDKFMDFIQENAPRFYNEVYQTHTLKERLISHFGDQILFWRPNYRSDLIYSSGIHTGEALEVALESAASENRILEDAAITLRRHIKKHTLQILKCRGHHRQTTC